MPLHSKEDVRAEILDDIYASADLSKVMPKYKMPEQEHDPRHAFAVVRDELMLTATRARTWRPSARPGSTPRSTS